MPNVLSSNPEPETPAVSYKMVLASIPDAVIVLDTHDRVLTANRMMLRYLRIKEDVEGHHVTEIFPRAAQLLEKYKDRSEVREEFELDGRYVEILVSPLLSDDRKRLGRVVVFRDINMRKQTEVALFAYERRYRALFEHSNDAVFILDLDLTILIANQRAAELLDVTLDELLQTSMHAHINPQEQQDMESQTRHLLSGELLPLYERRLVRRNDTQVWVEISLTLVRAQDGNPLHIQMIVRDISERKQAETALQTNRDELALLQQVDEEVNSSLNINTVAMISLDTFVRLSHADSGYIALQADEYLCIHYAIGHYPPHFIGKVIRYDEGIAGRVMVNQEPEFVYDVKRDPDYVPLHSKTQAVIVIPLISQQHLVGVVYLETSHRERFNQPIYQLLQVVAKRVAMAIDNSTLHQFLQAQLDELQRLYENVTRLEQLKTDMIRMASHDLKNPIGIVRGYLGMIDLERDEMTEMQKIAIEEITKATKRMQKIVEDILSLENIQQQAANQQAQPVNLNILIRRVVAEYRPQADEKFQSMQLEDLPEPDIFVHGLETQLYEAVANLIGNAIKYTPSDGIINVRLVAQGSREVQFEVEDNGYGIPIDRQVRLFEPFYRAKVEGTEEIEGTGLGLHLVRNIIERHHGQMIFQSTYGEGSTFGFLLPVLAMAASA